MNREDSATLDAGKGEERAGPRPVATSSTVRQLRLGKQVFSILLGLAMTAASLGVAYAMGPIPVWVGLEKSSFLAPPWYMATAALPFGILMAEALIDFREHRFTARGTCLVVSVVLLGVAHSVKYLVPLPLSGHGVILGFFLVHEMVERREGRGWKLLLGLAVLIQATWYKLFLWADPASLLAGIGLGLIVWSGQRVFMLSRR